MVFPGLLQVAGRHAGHTVRIRGHLPDLGGERSNIARWHQILRWQEFWDTTDRRADAWQTPRHCLDHRPWQPLRPRWQDEDIGLIEFGTHGLTRGQMSEEFYPVSQIQ